MAIIAAEPGTGKTTITLGAFKVLRAKGMARKMLVIAPLKPAYLVWGPEAKKWKDFQHFKVVVLHDKTRDESLIADADICVINPEGLDWLLGMREVTNSITGAVKLTADLARMRDFGFDILTIDELTKFKNVNTGRFRALKSAMGLFARRWGLTGSLVANGLLDLFGQCFIIDGGKALGRFISHYRNNYFEPTPDGFSWKIRKGAEPEIYERIAPFTLRLAAADFIDMPEVVYVKHQFDLPPAARKIYDAMQRDLFAELEKGSITAANAAARIGKCRQIACGAAYTDSDGNINFDDPAASGKARAWKEIHTDRLDIVESIVEELQGAPLLIGYEYQHDAIRLAKRFPQARVIESKNPKKMKEAEAAWNAGQVSILLGQTAATAHGINLQNAGNHVMFFAPTYNYEVSDQFVRRVWRQGNNNRRVFVHYIVAKKTVDEVILAAIGGKERTQNKLYNALREYAKNNA